MIRKLYLNIINTSLLFIVFAIILLIKHSLFKSIYSFLNESYVYLFTKL
jgi:hypothetical protein